MGDLNNVPRYTIEGYGRQDIYRDDEGGEFVYHDDFKAMQQRAVEAEEKAKTYREGWDILRRKLKEAEGRLDVLLRQQSGPIFCNSVIEARRIWLEENDPKDGTDCVTPFDHLLYSRRKFPVVDVPEHLVNELSDSEKNAWISGRNSNPITGDEPTDKVDIERIKAFYNK